MINQTGGAAFRIKKHRSLRRSAAGLATDIVIPKLAPSFETGDQRAVGPFFARLSAARAEFAIESSGRFCGLRHANAKLGEAIFNYFRIDCTGDYRIVSTRPRESEYFLFIPLQGTIKVIQGRQCIDAAPGQIALVGSMGGHTQKVFRGSSDLLVIEIAHQVLMRTLADEHRLLFDPTFQIGPLLMADLENLPTLRRFIGLICRAFDEEHMLIRDPATARACERALILFVNQSFRHANGEVDGRPSSPAVPFYVRRAQEYICANSARSIKARDLGALAGVSPRAIYYGFKRYLGIPPRKYQKLVRLNRARIELRNTRTSRRPITEVAFDAGYNSGSRFSRDYRAHFGETPTRTILHR